MSGARKIEVEGSAQKSTVGLAHWTWSFVLLCALLFFAASCVLKLLLLSFPPLLCQIAHVYHEVSAPGVPIAKAPLLRGSFFLAHVVKDGGVIGCLGERLARRTHIPVR